MAIVDIPNGLEDRHPNEIRKFLRQILGELQGKLKSKDGMIRVTSRLNSSETKKAVPVWVGTVEDGVVVKARRFDPGEVRFGQSNRSKVYEETVNDSDWQIHYRDWTTKLPEKTENGYGPGQAYGPREGFMYQLFVAIRITSKDGKHHHVGTITVGFKNKLNDQDKGKASEIMKNGPASKKYVDYLVNKSNFNLGGPVF